jgi:uncharacterized protein YkwD
MTKKERVIAAIVGLLCAWTMITGTANALTRDEEIIARIKTLQAQIEELQKQREQLIQVNMPSGIVRLMNADRGTNLGHLTVSPTLERIAQMKANDMAEKGYFTHTSPEGKTPWYWFQQAGYKYFIAGENVAVFLSDPEKIEQAWMNSPTHRANILNPFFTEVGVATARGKYLGQETLFVVQMFGKPAEILQNQRSKAAL